MKRGNKILLENKKGQFYLVAAIIIATIIIGISSIVNSITKSENTEIEKLSQEIKIEASHVIDFGTYNDYERVQMYQLCLNLTKDYINNKINKINSYFIFGDKDNLSITAYQTSPEEAVLTLDSENTLSINQNQIFVQSYSTTSENAILKLDNSSYNFEIKSGENFYLVLSKKQEGEKYVITN